MRKLVNMLRAMRLAKGLPQAVVARKGGVSRAYYSEIECGKMPSDVEAALKIVSGMRRRTNRTAGGRRNVGRRR